MVSILILQTENYMYSVKIETAANLNASFLQVLQYFNDWIATDIIDLESVPKSISSNSEFPLTCICHIQQLFLLIQVSAISSEAPKG